MPLTRRPNQSRIKDEIRNGGKIGVAQALEGVKQRHEAIVSPWEKAQDKPKFVSKVEVKYRLVIGTVKMIGSKAESAGITVWQLLEHGTKRRFMKLSPDWVSKTWPGRLSSGAGAGHKLGLDLNDPEGGIDARNWKETVAEAQKPGSDKAVESGWQNGFRKGFGR
jgi:hypothetical protein